MSSDRNKPYTDVTDQSFADLYIEDMRIPKLVRIKTRFPLVEDRRAPGNIDYADQTEHRTWHGKAPQPSKPYDQLRDEFDYSASVYKFVSDAPNESNLPNGYYATSSGLFPATTPPFTEGPEWGYQIGSIVYINPEFNNDNSNSGTMFIAKNTEIENMEGRTYYQIVDSGSVAGRMEWIIKPIYQAPTWPQVRFPNGAMKRTK